MLFTLEISGIMIKKLFAAILVLSLAACQSNKQPQSREEQKKEKELLLPKSTGSHSELLLLMDNDLFEEKPGRLIFKTFASEQYGLPRPEAEYKVIQMEEKDANHLLKRNKSIFIARIGKESRQHAIYNEWAKPQLIAVFEAPTEAELTALLKEKLLATKNAFRQHDLSVMQQFIRSQSSKTTQKPLAELGVKKILLPRSFNQTVEQPNLKIFHNKAIRTDQYIMFYKRPMSDSIATGQDIITVRDSIGKNYFAGMHKGSYMITEMQMEPRQTITEIDEHYVVETRGLWKTHGDLMGGPFLSYSFFNDKTNEIFTVESMIYGPDSDKRNVLLELECIMKTIRLE